MNNRKIELENLIRRAGAPTDADRGELRKLVESNESFRRILWGVLNSSDESLQQLAGADLTTDAGVKKALKVQTRALALAAVVDELLDFASTEPQQTKETQNDKS